MTFFLLLIALILSRGYPVAPPVASACHSGKWCAVYSTFEKKRNICTVLYSTLEFFLNVAHKQMSLSWAAWFYSCIFYGYLHHIPSLFLGALSPLYGMGGRENAPPPPPPPHTHKYTIACVHVKGRRFADLQIQKVSFNSCNVLNLCLVVPAYVLVRLSLMLTGTYSGGKTFFFF